MKVTALLVLKCVGAGDSSSSSSEGPDPLVLANATDVSHFGFFQRPAAREFILFVGRTVARRTPPSQRQSVQHQGLLSRSQSLAILGIFGFCLLDFFADLFDLIKSVSSRILSLLDLFAYATSSLKKLELR